MPDVKKMLEECVKQSETVSLQAENTEAPEAMAVSEARKLPQYVDNPQCLERLLNAPGMSFECPHSGMEMVFVPKYIKSRKESIKRETEHRQVVRGDIAIRAPPRAKAKAMVKLEGQAATPSSRKLPKGLKRKMEDMISSAQDDAKWLDDLIRLARTEEGKEYVTEKVLKRCEATKEKMVSLCDSVSPVLAKDSYESKEQLAAIQPQLNNAHEDMSEAVTKLEGTLACERYAQQ